MGAKKPSKFSGLPELLSSSAIWGAIPLIAVLSGGKENPLLFLTVWSGSGALGLFIYLRYLNKWAFSKEIYLAALGVFLNLKREYKGESAKSVFNIFNTRSILAPIHGLEFLILAWAFRYVNEIVGTIIFESWPVFFTILMGRLNKNYSISRRGLLFSVLAFLAVGLVVASNTSAATDSMAVSVGYIFGIIALLFTILLTLQDAVRLKQGEHIAKRNLKEPAELERETENLTIVLNIMVLVVSASIGFLTLAVLLAFDAFDSFTNPLSLSQILILFFGSALVTIGGTVLNTRGNIKGKDLRVQSVRYFTPVFGVVFIALLYPFRGALNSIGSEVSLSADITWPWLIAGLLGVVTANILTNLESEIGVFGLTSFVVSLWFAGALVYFRDEWGWWTSHISNLGTGTLEYYSFLGVSATVLTLLIAFEVTRLEQRTIKEQEAVFWLLSRFELPSFQHLSGKPQKNLELLDKEKDIDKIQEYYMEIRTDLLASNPPVEPDVFAKLNSLAYSKQYGVAISSRVAIILLTLFSIALSLALRPSDIGTLSAIFVDSFAFILSAVMAYLTFHLFDLRNVRAKSSIESDPSRNGYVPEFATSTTRNEASIAIALVMAVTATYITLYSIKWLL